MKEQYRVIGASSSFGTSCSESTCVTVSNDCDDCQIRKVNNALPPDVMKTYSDSTDSTDSLITDSWVSHSSSEDEETFFSCVPSAVNEPQVNEFVVVSTSCETKECDDKGKVQVDLKVESLQSNIMLVNNENIAADKTKTVTSPDKLASIMRERILAIKADCAIELDTNEESNAVINEKVVDDKTVASSDKLAGMMRERIVAINSIRGLLEQEQEKGTNDAVLQLSNKLNILCHEVKCKEQANREIMKTVRHLKTKNAGQTQQIVQLTSTVDLLVQRKYEYIQRMDAMEEELTSKKTVIDEMARNIQHNNTFFQEKTNEITDLKRQIEHSVTRNDELEKEMVAKQDTIDRMSEDIRLLSTSCEELVAENINLSDQVQIHKTEFVQFKTTIHDLETKNSNYASEIEQVKSSNKELLNTVENFTKLVNDERLRHKKEIDELKRSEADAVARTTDSFQNEKSNLESELEEAKKMLQAEKEEKAAIVEMVDELVEELERTKAELERAKAFHLEAMATIEELERAKARHLEASDTVIQSKDALLEDLVQQLEAAQEKSDGLEVGTALLNAQLESIKTECSGLKMTVDSHEAKITSDANEIKNLMISLQDVVEINSSLQVQVDEVSAAKDKVNEEKIRDLLDMVESLTKTVDDERIRHEGEVLEIQNMFHEIKGTVAKVEEVKLSMARSFEDLTETIGQLEKDFEEEFALTSELKDIAENLMTKGGGEYDTEVADILGNVSLIQCLQISYLETVNRIYVENKEQVKCIQSL